MSTKTQQNQALRNQRRRLSKMVIDEVSLVDEPAVPQSSYLLVKRDAEGLLKAAGEEKPLSDSERIARLEEMIAQLMSALNGEGDEGDEIDGEESVDADGEMDAEADGGEEGGEDDKESEVAGDAVVDDDAEPEADSDAESDDGEEDEGEPADDSGTTQANVDGSVGDGVTTASNVDGNVTDEMATPNVKPSDDEGTESPAAMEGMAKDGLSSDGEAAAEVVADRDASEGKVDDSEDESVDYPWQSDEKLIAAVQADAAEQLASELDNWTGDEKKQQYIEDAANDTLSPDLVGVAHEIVAMGSDKWADMGVDVDDEAQLDALASMVGDAMLVRLKEGNAAGGKGSTATGEPNLDSDPQPAKDKLGDIADKGAEDAANADGDMVDVDSAGTVENPGPNGNPMPSSNIDRTAALQSVAQDAWNKTMGEIFSRDKATDWRGNGKVDANELDFRAHDAATHFLEGSPKIGDRLNMPLVNQNDMTLTTEGVKVRDYLAGFIKQRMAAYQHALESKQATWGKLWSGVDVDTDGASAPVHKAVDGMPLSNVSMVNPMTPVAVVGPAMGSDGDSDGDSDMDGDYTDSSYLFDSDAESDIDDDATDEVIGNAMSVAIQSIRSVADKLGPSGLSMLSGLILWAHHNCRGDAIRGEIGECITKGLAQVDDEPNEPVKVAKANDGASNHAANGTDAATLAKSEQQADEEFLSQLAAELEKKSQPAHESEVDWAAVLSALNGLQESKQKLDERLANLRA